MPWYKEVIEKLRGSHLFRDVQLVGGKVQSYSYALTDLRLAYPGDKRLFGWDDYPHENSDCHHQNLPPRLILPHSQR
jgi:hypothetical protein